MDKHSFVILSDYIEETKDILSFLNISILEESIIDFGIFEVIGKKESIETLKSFLDGNNCI